MNSKTSQNKHNKVMVLRVVLFVFLSSLPFLFSCKKEKVDTYRDYNENNPMLHADGDKIVDGNGKEIFLKGCIPLGWIQWEGTVWNCGLRSETKIREKITELVGKQRFEQFQNEVYQNFITEEDIIRMKQMGFNCVRIPFNHAFLEEDNNPYHYKQDAWTILDNVINWCEDHEVYVVLDLHAAAGGQSSILVSDPDPKKLWEEEENQKRTIALWEAIAKRYESREIIAGYDLLNEPNFPNVNELILLYEDIVEGIRKHDKNHLLFIEGNNYAKQFDRFNKPFSENMAWSFHTYDLLNNGNHRKHFEAVKKIAKKQEVPIWNGEFGANTLTWTQNVIDMFKSSDYPVSGWIFWPWKRVPAEEPNKYRHLFEVSAGEDWDKVRNYIAGSSGKPSAQEAEDGLKSFEQSIKIQNCISDPAMESVLKN